MAEFCSKMATVWPLIVPYRACAGGVALAGPHHVTKANAISNKLNRRTIVLHLSYLTSKLRDEHGRVVLHNEKATASVSSPRAAGQE